MYRPLWARGVRHHIAVMMHWEIVVLSLLTW